jgi:hypothetical protein
MVDCEALVKVRRAARGVVVGGILTVLKRKSVVDVLPSIRCGELSHLGISKLVLD